MADQIASLRSQWLLIDSLSQSEHIFDNYYRKEKYEIINNIIKIQKSSNGEDNYLYDKINKEYLVLMNIHFQGGAKSFMNENLKKFLNY